MGRSKKRSRSAQQAPEEPEEEPCTPEEDPCTPEVPCILRFCNNRAGVTARVLWVDDEKEKEYARLDELVRVRPSPCLCGKQSLLIRVTKSESHSCSAFTTKTLMWVICGDSVMRPQATSF